MEKPRETKTLESSLLTYPLKPGRVTATVYMVKSQSVALVQIQEENKLHLSVGNDDVMLQQSM